MELNASSVPRMTGLAIRVRRQGIMRRNVQVWSGNRTIKLNLWPSDTDSDTVLYVTLSETVNSMCVKSSTQRSYMLP